MEKRMNGELEQILQRLQSIEEKLEQLTKKPVHQHFQVQQMTVYEPYLENLTYQLERINIKELSGSLNIGNNFEMISKEKKKKDWIYKMKKQPEPVRKETKKETESVRSKQVNDQIKTSAILQDQKQVPSLESSCEQREIEQTHLGYRVKIERKKRRG